MKEGSQNMCRHDAEHFFHGLWVPFPFPQNADQTEQQHFSPGSVWMGWTGEDERLWAKQNSLSQYVALSVDVQ